MIGIRVRGDETKILPAAPRSRFPTLGDSKNV